MSRTEILNAFSPAQEVVDPRLFAGRHRQVKELSDALRTVGSCPIIYGDRGIGKTSLAIQCQLIAMGHDELLHQLGLPDYVLADDETFLTFFVTCSDDVYRLQKSSAVHIECSPRLRLSCGGYPEWNTTSSG